MMLVCNLSHKLPSGQEPFETVRNTSEGFTERCGCPPGTDEDEDTCLCYKSPSKGERINNIALYIQRKLFAYTSKTV